MGNNEDFGPQAVVDTESPAVPEGHPLAITERLLIQKADEEIQMAQYYALHNRLEDFVVYMIEMGYLARNAISEPSDGGKMAPSDPDYLFEFIEAYLDEANEHEDRGPLDQILHPDMTEFTGEPDSEPVREVHPAENEFSGYGSTAADPGA